MQVLLWITDGSVKVFETTTYSNRARIMEKVYAVVKRCWRKDPGPWTNRTPLEEVVAWVDANAYPDDKLFEVFQLVEVSHA